MIPLEKIIDYCMNFPGAGQDFPFDQETMTFKVAGKMFALVNVNWWMDGNQKMNLKCDPKRARKLRERYESVTPGYHMNKKHWNTVNINDGELSESEIFELIDHSYDLVVKKLTKKDRDLLA